MANVYDTNVKLQAIADAITAGGGSDPALLAKLQAIADAITNGGGGGGGSFVEMTKTDYEQITPDAGKVYFVYDDTGTITYEEAHASQGTSYHYSDVSSAYEHLAVAVSLNGVMYAGFIFDTTTRDSVVMSAAQIIEFATIAGVSYDTNSSMTLTQDTNTPSLSWVNGANYDTLYLDATDLSNVGTKCGYSGCISYLFYDKQTSTNNIFLNSRQYS